MVFAGLFFRGREAEVWLKTGLRILQREVSKQILADGGHFERSPMYHGIILEDLLDLLNLAGVYSGVLADEVIDTWREAAQSMGGWLQRRAIRLIFLGDGANKTKLMEQARNMKLDNVLFLVHENGPDHRRLFCSLFYSKCSGHFRAP